MSTHDRTVLASYAFGALPAGETEATAEHLASCAECSAEVERLNNIVARLDTVPSEVLLDGPIDDGDVFFARLLHAAGAQPVRTRRRWSRFAGVSAAAVILLAGVFGVGVFIGTRDTPSQATPTGVRTVTAHDMTSGVGMMIDLSSFNGWVNLQGRFTGVTPGSTCQIVLVTKGGSRVVAGVWIAPPDARTSVVTVSGSAIVTPAAIVGVEVDTTTGHRLVTGTF